MGKLGPYLLHVEGQRLDMRADSVVGCSLQKCIFLGVTVANGCFNTPALKGMLPLLFHLLQGSLLGSGHSDVKARKAVSKNLSLFLVQ